MYIFVNKVMDTDTIRRDRLFFQGYRALWAFEWARDPVETNLLSSLKFSKYNSFKLKIFLLLPLLSKVKG